MKKLICLMAVFSLVLTVLTGCKIRFVTTGGDDGEAGDSQETEVTETGDSIFHANTSKSYTFNVETGDQIKVELNTKGGYQLTKDLPFTISCDDDELSQGTFLVSGGYELYVEEANSNADAVVLETGEKDGNEFIFWCYDNGEWNYVIKVKDSNTGIALGNNISEESARECFERLTFTCVGTHETDQEQSASDTVKTVTFNVETGDRVRMSLKSVGGYDLTSEVPFAITCGEEELIRGIFITEENYAAYVEAAQSDADAVVLETGEKDGNEFVSWCYNDAEWNYVIKLKDANIGILMSCPVSEETARDCFERLSVVADNG